MSGTGRAGAGRASCLDLLVAAFEAGRATLWELDRAGEEWRPVAERTAGDRPVPAGRKAGARGHPFTWSLREALVVQVPAERAPAAGADDGWLLVAPVPGVDRVVALWFAAPPGPLAREAAPQVQAHLAWLCAREAAEAPPAGQGEPEGKRGV